MAFLGLFSVGVIHCCRWLPQFQPPSHHGIYSIEGSQRAAMFGADTVSWPMPESLVEICRQAHCCMQASCPVPFQLPLGTHPSPHYVSTPLLLPLLSSPADLAQLIYDLHQVNEQAKVSVKLVAQVRPDWG